MGEKLQKTPNLEEATLAATTARHKIVTALTLCSNCPTPDLSEEFRFETFVKCFVMELL
jgi:hypothetical protein